MYGGRLGFPGGSDGKESTHNAGDLSLIPGLGRSSGGGHDNPSSILAWRIPWAQGSLAGYSPWSCKELDMIGQLSTEQVRYWGREESYTT